MSNEPNSRRPITSRDSNWAKKFAHFLAKNNVSPNFISILSIVFSIFSLVALYFASMNNYNLVLLMIIAFIGIQGRLIMNLLDGMVAIEYDKKSPTGSLYNEVPDRLSDSLILFGVGLCVKEYAYGMDLAYLAIILSIATAYIRVLGASLNSEHFFLGPMAKQHRMALVSISCIIAIWYIPIFYYALMLMNFGLILTCFRRLAKVSKFLKIENK